MKARPILFSGPMVRALLDGRKTQTRRVVKDQHLSGDPPRSFQAYDLTEGGFGFENEDYFWKSPYGEPGNLLYVREKWATSIYRDNKPPRDTKDHELPFWYHADGSCVFTGAKTGGPAFMQKGKWRPSIHMPRWASRITLQVKDIRVERVQEISEQEAEQEGCNKKWYREHAGNDSLWPCPQCNGYQVHWCLGSNLGMSECDCVECDTSVKMFKHLWNSINGDRDGCSWMDNPWVWCFSFSVILKNVDEVIKGNVDLVNPVVNNDAPSNCSTCNNKISAYNQCRLLCGHTKDKNDIAVAREIRNWRSAVGLHNDAGFTDIYVHPTSLMNGCPYWRQNSC